MQRICLVLFILIICAFILARINQAILLKDDAETPLLLELKQIKRRYDSRSAEYENAVLTLFQKAIVNREYRTVIAMSVEVGDILLDPTLYSAYDYYRYLENMYDICETIPLYTSALNYNDKLMNYSEHIYEEGDDLLAQKSLLYIKRALLCKKFEDVEEAIHAKQMGEELINRVYNKQNSHIRHSELQFQILLGLFESNYDSALEKIGVAINSYYEWILLLEESEHSSETQSTGKDYQERQDQIHLLKKHMAEAYVYAGEVCKKFGQIAVAKVCFYQAFSIFEEIKTNNVKWGECINAIIECEFALGHYADAIALLDLNGDILEYMGSNDLQAKSSKNYAIYYDMLQDYDRALIYANTAADIIASVYGTNNKEYASSLLVLSNLYINSKNIVSAEMTLSKVLDIYNGNLDTNDRLALYHTLGKLYFLKGNYEKGVELYEEYAKILAKNEYLKNSINTAVWYADYATCLLPYMDKDSIDFFAGALELFNSLDALYHPIALHCLYFYPIACLNNNETISERYFALLMPTLKYYYTHNFAFISEREREDIWDKYPQLKDILFSMHGESQYSMLYDYLLYMKSLLLKTTINFRASVLNSGDNELREKYNLWMKYQSFINMDALPIIFKDKLVDVSKALTKMEREVIMDARQIYDYSQDVDYSLYNVQLKMNANDVTIEFADFTNVYTGNVEYVALLLRKGMNAPQIISLCNQENMEQVYYLRPDHVYWRQHADAQMELIHKYYKKGYELIWSKLEPYINEGDNVYFSPAGLLHQMNIEVLQDENGKLANEKWNLHRVSSTRELCISHPRIEHTSAVLYGGLRYNMDSTALLAQSRTYARTDDYLATRGFVADSTYRGNWGKLAGTVDEVNNISKKLNEHRITTTKYMDTCGTEESFKALSGKKTPIIHLATHGFFYTNEEVQHKSYFELLNMDKTSNRPDNSLKRSGLILAGAQLAWDGKPIPDSVEDGILLAEEIATMDLSGTDLVVLSACQTGLGEITSEGVFGLQRAFKKAGVQTLIMSLWKVDDDATRLMMETFYNEWLSGKSKHEAFAIAQQTVRSNKRYKSPYYWASFIMLD